MAYLMSSPKAAGSTWATSSRAANASAKLPHTWTARRTAAATCPLIVVHVVLVIFLQKWGQGPESRHTWKWAIFPFFNLADIGFKDGGDCGEWNGAAEQTTIYMACVIIDIKKIKSIICIFHFVGFNQSLKFQLLRVMPKKCFSLKFKTF